MAVPDGTPATEIDKAENQAIAAAMVTARLRRVPPRWHAADVAAQQAKELSDAPQVQVRLATYSCAGSTSSSLSAKNTSAACTPAQSAGSSSTGRPGSEYGNRRQSVSART